jgi:dUTP pyrophosphatase
VDTPIVRCVGQSTELPAYQSAGASGADLQAWIPEDIVVAPGARVLVPTGLRLEIPPGLEGQVRPRSGLAARSGLTVLNTPGTIDSDYRGEVKVILINLGNEEVRIRNGDRIAQIVFCPVIRVSFARETDIAQTSRGSGGFGSTGV